MVLWVHDSSEPEGEKEECEGASVSVAGALAAYIAVPLPAKEVRSMTPLEV